MLSFQMVQRLALSRVLYSVCKRTERPPGMKAVPEIMVVCHRHFVFQGRVSQGSPSCPETVDQAGL